MNAQYLAAVREPRFKFPDIRCFKFSPGVLNHLGGKTESLRRTHGKFRGIRLCVYTCQCGDAGRDVDAVIQCDKTGQPGEQVVAGNLKVTQCQFDGREVGLCDGGIQTIQPGTTLPVLSYPVTIDATTQPECSGYPCIELNGDTLGGGTGLALDAADIVVRGLIIGGFAVGIQVNQERGVVQGNFIGTDILGAAPHENGVGVQLEAGAARVGGTTAAERNLVSGNDIGIVVASGTANHVISGNYIGTNASGATALPNETGISLIDSNGTLIGGTAPGAGNVISGNVGNGILVTGSAGASNVIAGNYIGTDASGTAPLGNKGFGIRVAESNNIRIGSNEMPVGNVISGNREGGVLVESPDTAVAVTFNFIGTDKTGTARIANENVGVAINSTMPSLVVLNVISGNNGYGLVLNGDKAVVLANKIGTDVYGTGRLANLSGIAVDGNANVIGGTFASNSIDTPNIVAYNFFDGIVVQSGISNLISQNSIYENGNKGISLLLDANNNQAAPELTRATLANGTQVQGTLTSTPSTAFTVEFFSNPACSAPTMSAQGQTYLGSAAVTSDASGTAALAVTLAVAVPLGQGITATATDADDNTSEFSNCVAVESVATTCNTPPFAPALLLPPNGSVVQVRQAPLSWSSADCAETYRVQVRRVSTGKRADNRGNLTEPHYTTKGLQTAQNYTWRVRGCNDVGCGPWSGWSTFRVGRSATLAASTEAWWSMSE